MKLTPLLLLAALLALPTQAQPRSLLWPDLAGNNTDAQSVFDRINPALDGKQVVIPGFIIENSVAAALPGHGHDHVDALASSAPTITVLSPQPEICLHKPPPPANQLIQVKLKPDVTLEAEQGKPVYLIGELQVDKHLSGLFSTAYTLWVSAVEPYPVP